MADLEQDYAEIVVGTRPLRIRRRVAWGECDPAGVVYTPRFSDYATSATLWFIKLILRPHLSSDIGSPLKAMRYEFHRTLKPDELFEMRVGLLEIRHRTFDLEVRATDLDGGRRFTAITSPILVSRQTFVGVPIPDDVRAALESYRSSSSDWT